VATGTAGELLNKKKKSLLLAGKAKSLDF